MKLSTIVLIAMACLIAQVFANNERCTRDFEGIIYNPPFCSITYFKRLEAEFRVGGQAIFGSEVQRETYILNFINANQVAIDLVPTIGRSTDYAVDGSKTPGNPILYPDFVRPYLNFGAFINYDPEKRLYYTFQLFSPKGEQYLVSFSIPIRHDPIACCSK